MGVTSECMGTLHFDFLFCDREQHRFNVRTSATTFVAASRSAKNRRPGRFDVIYATREYVWWKPLSEHASEN